MSYVKNLDINGSSYEIKSVAANNVNDGSGIKTWVGTKAQYDAIVTKDSLTRYTCSDTGDIYLGDVALGKAVPTRNIGEIVSSTIPLTDAGLHLLDGALIQGDGIYSAFVDYIAGLVSTYPSVFTTESAWQSSVSTYGVCGKFVYNSTNNTVRLPKITGILEGTTDVNALGDLVQAGLPQHTHTRGSMNITGREGDPMGYGTNYTQGCFYTSGTNNGIATTSQVDYDGAYHYFDASRSWTGSTSNANYTSTVNTSSTVQPQTIKCYYYIVIATSTKTDIQVDIDNVVSDLNGKADVDLTNVTNVANIKMVHNAMPSGRFVELTFTHGASYIAPADGYFFMGGYGGSAGTSMTLIGNGLAVAQNTMNNNNSSLAYLYLPARKGNTVTAYQYNGTVTLLRFVYAVGSESEAS